VSTSELVHRLVGLIRAKNASTFYLNGPPGSGKSHLLKDLAKQLCAEIPHSYALGPYSITWSEALSLGGRLLQDLTEAGYLDEVPPIGPEIDLVSTWQWLGENIRLPTGQSFLVFIDLVGADQSELPRASSLFSSVRYLEGRWNRPSPRIFHLIAGCWDHPDMERHFQSINTSFPYTVGHNYMAWRGLCVQEMMALVKQVKPGEATSLHGQMLFELTGGHPAATLEILDRVASDDLTLSAILSATHQAAVTGPVGQSLVGIWCQLPYESRLILKELLLQRHVLDTFLSAHSERLLTAGIVRRDWVGGECYLSFRSWYVELLVHLHTERLGIADEQIERIHTRELVPAVREMNVQAYRLINDIENAMRNFVTVQLLLEQEGTRHMLIDKCIKYSEHGGIRVREDAYQRAQNWQSRSADGGMPIDLNPLITYCSVSDLADLVEDISRSVKSTAWQRIALSIRDLRYVRDAVMHNQLIDDRALQRLHDLQAEIYGALNEQKKA